MILAPSSTQFIVPILGGTLLFGLLITFIIYFVYLYKRSQNKLLHEQAMLKQALLAAEIEIKEQTLLTVSRELHDNYGQIASLIKINLNMISGELSAADKAKVEESLTLIKQLIGDIKSLASSLRGETILQVGWIGMIEKDVQRVNAMGETMIHFEYPSPIPLVDPNKQIILYRVVQEIINNLVKHARAKQAAIYLRKNNNKLFLDYSDNGVGFEPDTAIKKNGLGLNGMYERCVMIGAQFELKSKPGEGTQLRITFS